MSAPGILRLSRRTACWIGLFLVVNFVFLVRPSTNPLSRYALLNAMVEDHSFRIDAYREMTIDWARTPDGHYFSNKAPGPALLGYPLYWLLDRMVTCGAETRGERDKARWDSMPAVLHLVSCALEAAPFALVVALAAAWLEGIGTSMGAIHFFVVAALFGNTASLFMNSFFGHGLAASLVLAMTLSFLKRADFWAGLFFGLAVLCDYGAALLLPGALALMAMNREPRALARFIAGGVAPFALWTWYHTACFGSPFALPAKYQNPAFVDVTGTLFSTLPSFHVMAELVAGPSRGVLWAEPWCLLVCAAFPFFARGEAKRCGALVLPGLLLLFFMNAAFHNWQGGETPGPRYLSIVFPALALLAGLFLDRLPRGMKILMWTGLGVSVGLFVLFFAAPVLAPPGAPLWPFYLKLVFGHVVLPDFLAAIPRFATVRLMLLVPLFSMASVAAATAKR